MIVYQVKFGVIGEEETCAGILLGNGDVICACCGGVFEADERGETWEILEEYEDWVDFSEAILA